MKPKLFESLMANENESRQLYEKLKENTTHPFLKRYCDRGIKEGFFSDMTGALGKMHDTLVAYAWPELIGRSMIKVKPTTEAMERFPLDEGAVAYRYAEGTVTRLSAKKKTTVDIPTDILADASDEWTREYIEDATWNVLDNAVENVGLALGQKETETIISLYGAIADADLAGGAVLSGGGAVLSWAKLLELHQAVRGENWRPTVLAVNEMQLHQLLNDDKFIHAQYLPSSQTDLEQGTVTSVLGMKVLASTLVPNGTAYAIDTRVAAIMLLRRDVTAEDWEDTKNGEYGIRATTRFGLGVLRSKAVAKMTNIKQTLS
ncbi:MAG: phage major capsid protein [Candidatus Bathyarchaeota archaeon]|nr:phage major capsid protein [Candidatus Bathyarchaeota archaeon]